MDYPSTDQAIQTRFARNLRAARRRAGLTRRQLAARAGVALAVLVQIESASFDPDLVTVDALARAVGQAAYQLLTF
jgi:transcriptional regulator with XRE-family HTH domain